MKYEAEDVTITVDGVEIGGVTDVAVTFSQELEQLGDKIERLCSGVYETTLTMVKSFEEMRDFFEAIDRGRAALVRRLAPRVLYGGRKGRSAARRLWALGYVAVLERDELEPSEPGVIIVPRRWRRRW